MRTLFTLLLVLILAPAWGQDLTNNKQARKEANKFARRHCITPKVKRVLLISFFIGVAVGPVVADEYRKLKNQNNK